ncbi:MAG: hypothetical protein QGF00_13890 [Planctomycetota bacterium]|jgi:hypothetical protein|nr:hypothetical protein [Planctomycetota bacterium]MDP7250692.1 hypothetical protein [Planctomycetota bacterium]
MPEERSKLEDAAKKRMHPLLVTAYLLLIAWCVGAFGWIFREMTIQHGIFEGIESLRKEASDQARANILVDVDNAPLYIVQELQQEPVRSVKVRLASVLEKAIGRSPRKLDPGSVFAVLSNEVTTLEKLLDGNLPEIDTSWLTDKLRTRLKSYQRTSQLVMTSEEQDALIESARQSTTQFKPELTPQVVYFVQNRWSDLSKERENRIVDFVDSFLRINNQAGDESEKEQFIDLTVTNIRSKGQDLLPEEKKWLATKTVEFLTGYLPEKPWKATVIKAAKNYALYGWTPLISEEEQLLEQSLALKKEYQLQRARFAETLTISFNNLVEADSDVPRTLITEMVSLFSDLNPEISEQVSDSLITLTQVRLKRLASQLTAFSLANPDSTVEDAQLDELVKVANTRVQDVIVLLRKTLYREQVPSVMAVKTRTKTKEERKKELERLLRVARISCADSLGRVGLAARKTAEGMDKKSGSLMNDLVVEQARKSLKGILGDASPKVVSAAQAALRRIDTGS